jgi:Zinc-ribbon containing domain
MGLVGAFRAFLFDRSEPVSHRKQRGASGTYRCAECNKEVSVSSAQSLPLCPICKNDAWEPLGAAQNR